MKRANDSIDDSQSNVVIKKLSLNVSFSEKSIVELNLNPTLPDEAKLSKAKFYLITDDSNGKVLGCGEITKARPENSRFVLRLFNRDFYTGSFKDYLEMTMDDFMEIHAHKSQIQDEIEKVRAGRVRIFKTNDLEVFVRPKLQETWQPMVEIENKDHEKRIKLSTFIIDTFLKMMKCLSEVTVQHANFIERQNEDIRCVKEMLNFFAYLRNEKRPRPSLEVNDVIWEPNVNGGNDIFYTSERMLKHIKSILPKLD